MAFDWDAGKKEAQSLDDKALVERMQDAARTLVVLWREADSRSGLEVSVGFLEDRIGIIVESRAFKAVVFDGLSKSERRRLIENAHS